MSLFETKTADNFIFEETLDPREDISSNTPFLRKNVSYVVDQQAGNGSYTSGEVIIDSQAIAASGNMIDWRNATLAVPLRTKWDLTFAAAAGSLTTPQYAKFALALKNCSLLDSLKVEANGKTIITATQGLSQLVNFKLLTTMTAQSLAKDGPSIGFYPDDDGLLGDGGDDIYNNANDPVISVASGDKSQAFNRGLVERQNNFLPLSNTNFMSADNVKQEAGVWDVGTGTISAATTPQTPSDIHYVAVIRLKDLHDYFDKHSLSRGVSYRFTLKFNQAVTTVSHPSSTGWSSSIPSTYTSTTSVRSGSCQPAIFCANQGTMLGRISWTNPTTASSVITHEIDTTTDARFSGVRLYVPSYELEPSHQEKLLATQPIVKKSFMDFMTQTTQQYAAAGSAINVQVSTSVTNPRALIVIPRWSQTATGNGGQGYYSDVSVWSTAPATPDPMLSLTNIQVKMGSNYVLPDRMFYGWQQFLDHTSNIFSAQGNQSNVGSTGLITKKSFDTIHRYYAFDLSRYPEAMNNLPQMVSLECTNNTQKSIELLCILLYSRDVEFNLASGSMTITA
jgi:hypothetical protein